MSRPTWAEVDLSAIRDNVRAIRERVGPKIGIMPAVKADGYGHGAVEVSRACLAAGAGALCVACVEEGMELRAAGIRAPILILGCSLDDAAPEIVRNDIASVVCDIGFARSLAGAAAKQAKKAQVHVKIDTGMGRIGIQPDGTLDFVRQIVSLPGLELAGLLTHFPTSDEPDHSFTMRQIGVFAELRKKLADAGIRVPVAHASNSGGILAFPQADFDLVRPGIMVYGCYPSPIVSKSIPIREAMTLKSRIVFLKHAERGTTLSYGRTYRVDRKSKIATLPIGYGDGYSRLLSNKGEACVRGVRVRVVGRVCMDQILIDVTDVPHVQLGDEVTLYGGGYDYLSVSRVAEKIGTISYEVFCNLSGRVPRVYLNSESTG